MENQGRILIADDEEIFLRSTADLLRREGFHCDTAPDAPSAKLLLHEGEYDVLISDIRMPGNASLELLQELSEENRGIPVILVTGYPSMPTALQAIQYHAAAYLLKPVEFQELLDHVTRLMSMRRLHRGVKESAGRLQLWVDDMRAFERTLASNPAAMAPLSLHSHLAMSLGNVAGALLDLQMLFELAMNSGNRVICGVENCPRLEMYQNVIREGVDTLERTKGAFKSRDLGELRQKLERVLK